MSRNGHSLSEAKYVEAGEVRRRPLRVSINPLPSLLFAVRDALGAQRGGTPPALAEQVRRNLRAVDLETMRPLVTPRRTLTSDALLALAPPPGGTFSEGIERLLATPQDDFAAELAVYRALPGQSAWIDAERNPGRWLQRYVACLMRGWAGFEPFWQRAQRALDRETERIGLATALDAQLELLDGLLPSSRVCDARWYLVPGDRNSRFGLAGTGLVLMPMLAGPRSSIVAERADARVIGSVAYPARGALEAGRHDDDGTLLEALLGAPRAAILRVVGTPTTTGRLAELLGAVPSAATHHVNALEAAGLVQRERRGRRVLVTRTARGEALVGLYQQLDRRSGRRAVALGLRSA